MTLVSKNTLYLQKYLSSHLKLVNLLLTKQARDVTSDFLRVQCLYLWFARLSGIGCVELLKHPFILGLYGLLLVDVVHLRLPTTKHQYHWAGFHPLKIRGKSYFVALDGNAEVISRVQVSKLHYHFNLKNKSISTENTLQSLFISW